MLKNILSAYHLVLAIGAFYVGGTMLLGRGVFDTFPSEWVGVMPFSSWAGLAIFGMIVFGIGNALAGAYGFIKKDRKLFIVTIAFGVLCFACASMPMFLLGEGYLPLTFLFIVSFIQIAFGLIGLAKKKSYKELNFR
ncbi:hypothetical protein [Jeotgalibacillus proteolyticus]|uniref:Uncharacterized protein n=1 Tax=Jeotgalibacillus proteolyticus TaxID=2082395 RepID=A0A2S5GCI5_9BACL|nr:hypothetical protein [Jeotgalibacillus proteolyticus]PPA70624.1 hypothetical protein C4B60_07430 [Jeotgalibacillus proteolyticus]